MTTCCFREIGNRLIILAESMTSTGSCWIDDMNSGSRPWWGELYVRIDGEDDAHIGVNPQETY